MSTPTSAKVDSLTHWSKFFHPTNGIFRLPSTEGRSIEHLDIDLRFIDHEFDNLHGAHHQAFPKDLIKAQARANGVKKISLPAANVDSGTGGDIYLPNVVVLTLRGAEHVQDSEDRMDALAEVLLAFNPVEIRWLNATSDPTEQLTFSTHLVHPSIISAGEIWARQGTIRKLVIQGGFPCPNLSAPTPFFLTPAATPCGSPGTGGRTTFGSISSLSAMTTLPSLSMMKPKSTTNNNTDTSERSRARAERKRLAEYSLKPRFEFAFGTWGAETIEWRLDGRYTPACIVAIVEHLLNALVKSFPFQAAKDDVDMPSLLSFAPLPAGVVESIRGLTEKLELEKDLLEYLNDCVFFSTSATGEQYSRIWQGVHDGAAHPNDRERSARRMKAEMLLIQSGSPEIVSITDLVSNLTIDINNHAEGSIAEPMSPNGSASSLVPGDTEATTDDEDEATTPDMDQSLVLEAKPDGGKRFGETPLRSLSDSLSV